MESVDMVLIGIVPAEGYGTTMDVGTVDGFVLFTTEAVTDTVCDAGFTGKGGGRIDGGGIEDEDNDTVAFGSTKVGRG